MKREEAFVENVLKEFGPVKPFKPCTYYDADGDCIEFLLSNRPFFARRLDHWVTVYYGENTEEVSGGLIKDVAGLLRRFPGLDIEIRGGKVKLACILRASAWSTGDPVIKQIYKAVIDRTEESEIMADYELAGA